MKLLLIGIQGSGKSTQGNLLSEKYSVPYLSSGAIFRNLAKEDSEWGREVKDLMKKGILIPDQKVNTLMTDYLSRDEYKNGYILDGYPRTVAQAQVFEKGFDKVIHITLTDKEALWRISSRKEEREDETIGAVRKRIELFHRQTEPLISYYQEKGILISVNGEQTREQVFADIVGYM